jgi:hypothetical protein
MVDNKGSAAPQSELQQFNPVMFTVAGGSGGSGGSGSAGSGSGSGAAP